ncbi:MAG: BMP family protein [Acidimicrobiia bacterium]
MKRNLRYFAVLVGLAVVAAACSPAATEEPEPTQAPPATEAPATTHADDHGDDHDETTTTEAAETMIGEGVLVGMAFDVGGRGDLSFNDLAAKAWDEGKVKYGYDGQELAPDAGGENREENLRLLAETGHSLIIANGFAFAQNVWRVGTEFPEVMFAITDSCPQDDSFATVDMPNVRCMLFAEHEGSFLVGAAAALKSQTNKIGFIGGVQIGLIEKFQAGFEAGARYINPDVEILVDYLTQPPDFSGFGDPVKGKESALAMYAQGADVVYHAAGGSGLGLFQAAAEASTDDQFLWAIGVDADQYNTVGDPALQEHILTSMLKRVDVAVGNTIEDFLMGEFTSGPVVFDLAAEGVGYSTTGGFVDDIVDQLEDIKAKIISGEIEVPDALG